MKKAMVVLLVGLLAGCGDDVPENVEFTIYTAGALPADQVKKIEDAGHVLFEKCTALKQYLPDIVNNKAEIYDAEGFSERGDFGWKDFVQFDFTISDNPNLIPNEYHASGHHCLFRVSGDEMASQKTVCAHVCKGEAATVDNTYSLYFGKAERAKTNTNFNSVKNKALSGDYQAQRNLAYGYSSQPYEGQDINPILGCAWRVVIIKSGHERIDQTDVNNLRVYCGQLDEVSRTAADAQAEKIIHKMGH